MWKKALSLFAALLLWLSLTATAALAQTYTGDVLAAVNTVLDTDLDKNGRLIEAGFTPVQGVSSNQNLLPGQPDTALAGVSDLYEDPETGETICLLEPNLPELGEPIGWSEPEESPVLFSLGSYQAENTEKTVTVDNGGTLAYQNMICLYVGTYCTVWGSTQDNENIRIDVDIAQQVAEEFDRNFEEMTDSFGDYWYDADGDGKVAILCYDIYANYEESSGDYSDSYVAGYFWATDMNTLDSQNNPTINGIQFNDGRVTAGMDCIHIDTYPGMGGGKAYLSSVSRAYSTLIHEFQHMINFSYQVRNGGSGYFSSMDTYLNEAFSMAAEHMICGADATANRITYFNYSYTPGTSLTYWVKNLATLSNYCNSYLFGQYLRTRYGQKQGNSGDALFKTVLERRSADNSDTLAILADLLDTEEDQLILDFWAAVYLKEESGPYGFNGESWAERIQVQTAASFTSANTSGIYNGGVKYYALNDSCTVNPTANLAFLVFGDAGLGGHAPVASNVSALRTGESAAVFTLTSSLGGTLHYQVSESQASHKNALTQTAPLSAQTPLSLRLALPGGAEDAFVLSYYLESSTGAENELTPLPLDPWAYGLTVSAGPGGSVTVTDQNNLSYRSGDLVPSGNTVLTITAIPDSNYRLASLKVNGEDFSSGGSHPVTGAVQVEASFDRVYTLTLTTDGDGQGSASLSQTQAPAGTEITVTATPAAGSILEGIYLDGELLAGDRFLVSDDHQIQVVFAAVQASGVCGDNLTWHLLRDGTLRILGSGVMHEYSAGDAPWASLASSITSLELPAGLTQIGASAFLNCTGLTSLILPEGLIQIGGAAFSGCTGLESVVIPSSIQLIGGRAFYDCVKLAQVIYTGTPSQWAGVTIGAYQNLGELPRVYLPYFATAACFEDQVQLELTSSTPGRAVLAVYDQASGRMRACQTREVTAGVNQLAFTFSGLNPLRCTYKLFLLDQANRPLGTALPLQPSIAI